LIELLIIADDLTGAIDTGVQLAKQDIRTRVVIQPQSNYLKLLENNHSPVLVVNTESRHLHQDEARRRVNEMMAAATKAGIQKFYKKVDSTMRGNIGAELEAFKGNINQRYLGFVPAHPKLKRFTRNGFHFVGETPLQETVFGKDPMEPIRQNYIPALLQEQCGLGITKIDVSETRKSLPDDGLLVFDCESEGDLRKISGFLTEHHSINAIAGSAAMVELLPDLFQIRKERSKVHTIPSPALLINGSLNDISAAQVKYARDHQMPTHTISSKWLYGEEFLSDPEFDVLTDYLRTALIKSENIILTTTDIRETGEIPVSQHGARQYETISKKIGSVVHAIFHEAAFSTLIVFGGDTLMGIMGALSCKIIEPKMELLPGVALSLTEVNGRKIHIITKPGGYGDDDVIMKILDFINNMNL
jgi:uncharacterized protein YgbK (DUF1537 family)